MSWIEVLNREDHPWVRHTNNVLKNCKDRNELPFKLSNCIFDINQRDFLSYLHFLENIIGPKDSMRIGEIGCGNGALLLGLHLRHNITPSGVDISWPLIKACKNIFPEYKDEFYVGSKINHNIDICLMNSVVQYIPPDELAILLINTKCKRIVITDVKNSVAYDEFTIHQAKRQGISLQERNEKYKNTPLYYYTQEYFLDFPFDVQFLDMPSYYPDAEFSPFCVIVNKET